MDPLSFSAGIAGLLSLTIEITKLTYEYISGVKEAPRAAQSLLTETTAIENILRDLRNKVLLNPDVSAVFKSASMDHSARVQLLNQCESDLVSLLEDLKRESASTSKMGGLVRLRWPFKETAMQDKLTRLRWFQSQLATLASHDTLMTSTLTLQEVQSWRGDAIHNAILEWLSPLDFGAKQHDVLSRLHPGTVEWLIKSPEFVRWRDEDILEPHRRILWGGGPPGAGKTVASAVVVSHLSKRSESGKQGLAYAYCNYDDQTNQTSRSILGNLVKQLASQVDEPQEIFTIFSPAKRRSPPALEDILKCIEDISKRLERVFVVIDALDEAENFPQKNRTELLQACVCMAGFSSSLRVFVTSREHLGDIDRSFAQASRITIAASHDDLQAFIRARINDNEDLEAILEDDDMFKEHIISDILENSADQFLLPSLHIERLNDLTCKDDIEDILSDLTTSVDEAYRKTFDRLKEKSKQKQELVDKVLLWLCYTRRPLQAEELEVAVAYRWNEQEGEFTMRSRVPRKIILETCLGLVVSEQSGAIRLVHKSLESWFKINHRSNVDPEAYLGRSLLSYLSHESIKGLPTEKYDIFSRTIRQEKPLLPYAFHFWHEHAKASQDLFEKAILDYFALRPKLLPIPHDFYVRTMRTGLLVHDPPVSSQWQDLFYAVVLQLDQLVRRLVQRGINPFAYHRALGCPSIMTWISNSYMAPTNDPSLLRNIYDAMISAIFHPEHVNFGLTIHDEDYVSLAKIFPLLQESTMEVLISRGFDVNRLQRFSSPVNFLRMFKTEIARGMALHMASFLHEPVAIRTLLRHGAKVNFYALGAGTPLHIALHAQRTVDDDAKNECVKILREAGGQDRGETQGEKDIARRTSAFNPDRPPNPLIAVAEGQILAEEELGEEPEGEGLKQRRAKSHVRRAQYQSTSSYKPRQNSFRQSSTDALNEKITFTRVMDMDGEE
ncbi:hypothetical protein P154DRAFT_561154 [Amniculicola lignicola CBS 123094]|uniref:Nephrocystin 3-like N-terminal domain-containing protein n=1 Tax=Amniculicola lignicola CBS 123094 TaxID=1392246 RepID=A0A6A5WPC4_9PLEO|nr:hypothetical protein P154DRAFT_561154 [Amniculicola lignicola CBS 123094]